MRFKGAGLYDKSTGELIILGRIQDLRVERGEVWEGTRRDYNETFGIDDEVIITRRELARLIDQADCEDEGVLAKFIDKNPDTIEQWLEDKWETIGTDVD